MNGLGQDLELVAFCASFFEQIGSGGLPGEEQDFTVGHLFARLDGSLDAGHSRHDDVGDQHIWLKGVERFDGLFSAKNGSGLKSGLVEDDGQRICDYLFVVCN